MKSEEIALLEFIKMIEVWEGFIGTLVNKVIMLPSENNGSYLDVMKEKDTRKQVLSLNGILKKSFIDFYEIEIMSLKKNMFRYCKELKIGEELFKDYDFSRLEQNALSNIDIIKRSLNNNTYNENRKDELKEEMKALANTMISDYYKALSEINFHHIDIVKNKAFKFFRYNSPYYRSQHIIKRYPCVAIYKKAMRLLSYL